MSEQDVIPPDGAPWMSILERQGRGDQRTELDDRRSAEHGLWQASLKRRDDAIAELELLRAEPLAGREPYVASEPIEPLGPIDDDEARYAGEMGRWIPQFEYYSPVRRWIAKGASRVILFLTGFISVHQRRYNHLVLDKIAATQERLDELVGAVNEMNRRLEEMEGVDLGSVPEVAADDSEVDLDRKISVKNARVDALRREVHRLQCEVLSQSVEVADLQAERLGRRLRELDES